MRGVCGPRECMQSGWRTPPLCLAPARSVFSYPLLLLPVSDQKQLKIKVLYYSLGHLIRLAHKGNF